MGLSYTSALTDIALGISEPYATDIRAGRAVPIHGTGRFLRDSLASSRMGEAVEHGCRNVAGGVYTPRWEEFVSLRWRRFRSRNIGETPEGKPLTIQTDTGWNQVLVPATRTIGFTLFGLPPRWTQKMMQVLPRPRHEPLECTPQFFPVSFFPLACRVVL